MPYSYSLNGDETRAVSELARYKTPAFYYYDDSQTYPSKGECGLSICHCDVCYIPAKAPSDVFCVVYLNSRRNIVTSNATNTNTGWSSVGSRECGAGVSEALGLQLPERGSEVAAGGCAATWAGGAWGALVAAMVLLVEALIVV